MMKRIILLFAFVIASIMFYHSYDILNYTHYARIVSFPDTILSEGVTHTPIQIQANKKDNDNILKEFLKQAKKDKKAILYQAHPYSETGYNQYHVFLYVPNNDLMTPYYFDDEKNVIDFSKDDTIQYYTSADDEERYNKIRTYDSSYFIKEGSHVYIKPFIQAFGKTFEDEEMRMMIYGDHAKAFVENVKGSLKQSNVDFKWQDLSNDYEVGTFTQVESGEQSALIRSLMVSFVALILAYCSLVMKDSKKISIYKMHGYNDERIIMKLYGILYFQMVIIFIFTYIFWIFAKTQVSNELFYGLYIQIIKQMGYMIIFIPILLLITKMYIRLTCNVLSLKSHRNLEKILKLNIALKIGIAIILITPFINAVNDYIPLFRDYMKMSEHEDTIRNNLYLKRPLNYEDIDFSNELLKLGNYSDFNTYGIFSDKNNPFIMDENGLNERVYMAHPYIVANENYLRNYQIEDEAGMPISYNNLKDSTLLVPIAYKEIDLSAYSQGLTGEVVYIKNNETLVNESARSTIHTLRNPMIRYVNTWNSMIVNHGLHLPLTQEKDIEYYMKKATQFGVDLGSIAFGYTYADYDYYMVNAKQAFVKLGSILILYTFIFYLFLCQFIYLYVKKNQKNMAVAYIHGKSRIERYGGIMIINFCTYALLALISMFLLHNSGIDTLRFVIVFETFDISMQYLFFRYYEKLSISSILKGE